MKKQHSLLILCAAALLFAACGKGEPEIPCEDQRLPAIVEGYVFTGLGGDSIPDAKVILYEEGSGTGYAGIMWYDRKLDCTTTDEKGYYRMEFKGNGTAAYMCAAFKDGYYNFNSGTRFGTGYGFDCEANKSKTPIKVNQLVCPLVSPIAYMQFHIKNVLPTNAGDSISFFKNDYRESYGDKFSMVGANVDTVVCGHVLTGLGFSHYWDIYTNGVFIKESGIYGGSCSPGDTCKFDVFY